MTGRSLRAAGRDPSWSELPDLPAPTRRAGRGLPSAGGVGPNGRATAALIAAALTPLCGLGALVGLFLGHSALREIRVTGQSGRGYALAAVIVGWSCVACFVVLVATLALVAPRTGP